MITAASVTFSLASVALSTFLYSVLVVRSILGSSNSTGTTSANGFVPSISVTGSIALSLASLVLLVYFIRHISASIQAARIVRVIS